jgi:hypothetical protein
MGCGAPADRSPVLRLMLQQPGIPSGRVRGRGLGLLVWPRLELRGGPLPVAPASPGWIPGQCTSTLAVLGVLDAQFPGEPGSSRAVNPATALHMGSSRATPPIPPRLRCPPGHRRCRSSARPRRLARPAGHPSQPPAPSRGRAIVQHHPPFRRFRPFQLARFRMPAPRTCRKSTMTRAFCWLATRRSVSGSASWPPWACRSRNAGCPHPTALPLGSVQRDRFLRP